MEDHPLIAHMVEFAPDSTSLDDFANGFAVMGDPQRVEVLQRLRGHIDDDSVNLRQRSQLAQFTRRLDAVHSSLRRVGR